MNPPSNTATPPPDTQQMLDSLKQAVTKELEKKKRLGHYAVLWENDKPLLIGEDAPQTPLDRESKTT